MAKSSTLAPISDETKEMIEDHVKKGKARKFFMICKGVTINTLEVFKKGPFGPKIMKAKGEGFKGEITYGVVTGSGKELYFQLAGNQAVAEVMKVDGFFEKPPTKKAKLRDFLADNGLVFKPSYYIITDPAFAPDPDAESTSAKPPAEAEFRDDEGDETPSSTFPTEQAVSAPPSDTSQFTERLKALKPAIDQAVAAGTPVSAEIKLRVSEAAMFARKKEYEQANALLDQVEKLLKQGIPQAPPAPPLPTAPDASALFNKRLAAVVAELKQATGNLQADAAKLKVSEAGVFARKKEFDEGNRLLDEAEALLKLSAPESEPKKSTGAVSFAKARLDWQAAKKEVEGQLGRLQAAILAEFDDEEARSGVTKLELVLARFDQGLSDALDELYNAEPAKKPALAKAALKTVGNYLEYVESDELISHVEVNPYESLSVRSSLKNSLSEIESQLKSVG